jgi:hypothetical protein
MDALTLPAVIGFPAPRQQGFSWYDPNHLLAGHWLLLLLMTIVVLLLVTPRSSTRLIELARELLTVIPAVLLYDVVRGLVEGRESEAMARATQIVRLERVSGIFWEQGIQDHIMAVRPLMNFMNITYQLGMWPVIVLVAIWLFFQHRDVYPLYRNAFLISGAIGLVIYALLPVAPPRFVDGLGFVDTVAARTQAYSMPDAPLIVNQYAAMPSLHFGWVLLCGIGVIHRTRGIAWKLLGVYMPAAMFVAIVATGNHFILDAVAGAAVALLGLAASYVLLRTIRSGETESREPVPVFADRLS